MVLKIVNRGITWCENAKADEERIIAETIDYQRREYFSTTEDFSLKEVQSIMGRLITHLVMKGLINNDDLNDILGEKSYNRRFEVVEVEDEV